MFFAPYQKCGRSGWELEGSRNMDLLGVPEDQIEKHCPKERVSAITDLTRNMLQLNQFLCHQHKSEVQWRASEPSPTAARATRLNRPKQNETSTLLWRGPAR